jgi:HD superfamily phosphohydrolase
VAGDADMDRGDYLMRDCTVSCCSSSAQHMKCHLASYNMLLLQVVAGDADMDRGDYLMRDSVATGVQHSYDVTELMRASKVRAQFNIPLRFNRCCSL